MIQLSTSVGADGHTMALTERGEVFNCGDRDYLFIIFLILSITLYICFFRLLCRVPISSGNHGKSRKKVPCMEKSWNLKNHGKIMEFCEII